ncbi:putative transmembrane protein, partial [Toxoplasma gondii RUB]
MPIQMEKCVWVAKRPPGRATFCHWKERLCWKMGLLRSRTRNLLFLALTCLSATSGVFAIPRTTPRGLRKGHNEAVSGPTRFSAILLGGRRDRRQPTDNEYGSRVDTASTRRLTGLVARILASPPEEQDDAVGASARGARSRQPTGLPPPVPLARAESSRSAVRPDVDTGAGSVTYEGFGTARPPPPQVGVRALSGVRPLGDPRARLCSACKKKHLTARAAARLFLSAAAEGQRIRDQMSGLIFEENRARGSHSDSTGSSGDISSRLRELHVQMLRADNLARVYARDRQMRSHASAYQEARNQDIENMQVERRLRALIPRPGPPHPPPAPARAQGVLRPVRPPLPQGQGRERPPRDPGPPNIVAGAPPANLGGRPPHLRPGLPAARQGPPFPGQGPPFPGQGPPLPAQGPPFPAQGPPLPAQGPHPPRGHPPGPPQPGQNVFGLRPPRSPGR